MFMLVFPCFPEGGPHLFCPPTENQSVPSNEKPSAASKVWAHFLSSSPASANQNRTESNETPRDLSDGDGSALAS